MEQEFPKNFDEYREQTISTLKQSMPSVYYKNTDSTNKNVRLHKETEMTNKRDSFIGKINEISSFHLKVNFGINLFMSLVTLALIVLAPYL